MILSISSPVLYFPALFMILPKKVVCPTPQISIDLHHELTPLLLCPEESMSLQVLIKCISGNRLDSYNSKAEHATCKCLLFHPGTQLLLIFLPFVRPG